MSARRMLLWSKSAPHHLIPTAKSGGLGETFLRQRWSGAELSRLITGWSGRANMVRFLGPKHLAEVGGAVPVAQLIRLRHSWSQPVGLHRLLGSLRYVNETEIPPLQSARLHSSQPVIYTYSVRSERQAAVLPWFTGSFPLEKHQRTQQCCCLPVTDNQPLGCPTPTHRANGGRLDQPD